MKSRILCSTVAATMLAAGMASAEEAKAPAKQAAPKTYTKSEVRQVTATVQAIDVPTRVVTLKREDGSSVTFRVDERVKNLPQVKVGDIVLAKYYAAVAVTVLKAGEVPPAAGEAKAVAGAKPGEMPAGVATSEKTITATIESIDRKTNVVTLKGPEGNFLPVVVKHPERLEGVKVGDQVVITYTEALAVSVERPKSKGKTKM